MPHLLARLAFIALSTVCVTAVNAASTSNEANVVIVGTWHFTNPGRDIHNIQSDDVLTPGRQAEIAAVVDALARFKPNVVAVEASAADADEAYRAYREGKAAPSANEVVQLGFRLAKQVKLERVHGIDLPGEFPMDAVGAWAAANGKGDAFAALMARAGGMVAASGRQLATDSIGQVLRAMNAPQFIEQGQALYLELLRYGAGAEQPGAELNAAWQRRNYRICARLMQSIAPGDRAVVFFGQGHAHALRRCAIETPGVRLVEANDVLPRRP